MSAADLPGWAGYTVDFGSWAEHAEFMEGSAAGLGGLRIVNLGGGRIAFDSEAAEVLRGLDEDDDGCIDDTARGWFMWVGGRPFPVRPAGA